MCPTERRLRLFALCAALALAACSPKSSYQSMAAQPRYEAYEGSSSLPHGASALPLVPGVVARDNSQADALLTTGNGPDGQPADVFPFPVTLAVLERGQTEFNAYCAPCHDYAGTGHGITTQKGFPQPPSLHEDEFRAAPVGELFDVVTNGHGPMPAYGEQVAVGDRWAIVAYVRALQLSQHAAVADVPAGLSIEPALPTATEPAGEVTRAAPTEAGP